LRNLVYILILITAFSSCEYKKVTKELSKTKIYYPNKNWFLIDSTLLYFQLDSLKNFRELINKIDLIACENKTPVITFQNENLEYKLIPMNDCSERRRIFDYYDRNVLNIEPDKVIVDNLREYGIDSLSIILRNHYLNENKEPFFSDTPEKAFVQVYVDTISDIGKTKELLIKIMDAFDEIKGDSLSLGIQFEKYLLSDLSLPPPPPQIPLEVELIKKKN